MTGHIRQRSPGSFELRWSVGGQVKTVTVRGTKTEAKRRMRELLTAADQGRHVDRSPITVADWTAQRIAVWDVTERTRENYRQLAKLITAYLGDLQLQRLRTLDVERWHAELRAIGLASSTIRAAHRMLVRVMADAVHHKLAISNPAREQPPPRAPVRKVKVPTEDAIGPMLERIRGDPFYVPVVLTLNTGLRRGELLALSWQHVDLDAGTLRVERALEETAADGITFKDPKTASGERIVSLPAAAVEALREHRRAQLEMRLALGLGRPSDGALVFPRMDGQPQSPNAFSVAWIRTARRLGITVTWHGLRHLSASLLLRHGVDLATASRRLGHSRPDTTARLYLHAIAENDRHAADALDKALGQTRQ